MYREFQNLVPDDHSFEVSHVTAGYGNDRFLFGFMVPEETFLELPQIRGLITDILPRGYVLNAARKPEVRIVYCCKSLKSPIK
jgi:hypothetical protein